MHAHWKKTESGYTCIFKPAEYYYKNALTLVNVIICSILLSYIYIYCSHKKEKIINLACLSICEFHSLILNSGLFGFATLLT